MTDETPAHMAGLIADCDRIRAARETRLTADDADILLAAARSATRNVDIGRLLPAMGKLSAIVRGGGQ